MVHQGKLYDKYWSEKKQVLYHRHTSTLKLLPIKPEDGPVLDLGGGDGLMASLLIQRGFDVTVLDMSKEALKRCKKIGAKGVLGDLNEKLPFKKNSFVLVLNLAVLEHLVAPPENLIKEIHRVTKKYAIIGTSNWAHWLLRFQNLFGMYPRWPRPLKGDIRWISYSYAKKIIENNKFKIIKRDVSEISPKILPVFAYLLPNLCAMNFTFLCEKNKKTTNSLQ